MARSACSWNVRVRIRSKRRHPLMPNVRKINTPVELRALIGGMEEGNTMRMSTSCAFGLALAVSLGANASAQSMKVTKDSTTKKTTSEKIRVSKDTAAVQQSSGEVMTPAPAPTRAPAPAPVVEQTRTVTTETTTSVTVMPMRSSLLCNGCYIGAHAGGLVPVQEFRDGFKDGYGVAGLVGYQPELSPLGIQLDAGFGQVLGRSNVTVGNATFNNPNTQMWHVGGAVRLETPKQYATGAAVYAIGGGQWNHISNFNAPSFQGNAPIGNTSTANRYGANIGGGVEWGIGAADLFLEARLVHLFNNSGSGSASFATNYVPVTFGFRVR